MNDFDVKIVVEPNITFFSAFISFASANVAPPTTNTIIFYEGALKSKGCVEG